MNESQVYEWLGTCADKGHKLAYIEVLGGGLLGVSLPLSHTDIEYALMTDLGLGLYPHNWEGEEIALFYFEDLAEDMPEWQKATLALEWMAGQL